MEQLWIEQESITLLRVFVLDCCCCGMMIVFMRESLSRCCLPPTLTSVARLLASSKSCSVRPWLAHCTALVPGTVLNLQQAMHFAMFKSQGWCARWSWIWWLPWNVYSDRPWSAVKSGRWPWLELACSVQHCWNVEMMLGFTTKVIQPMVSQCFKGCEYFAKLCASFLRIEHSTTNIKWVWLCELGPWMCWCVQVHLYITRLQKKMVSKLYNTVSVTILNSSTTQSKVWDQDLIN